MASLNKYVNEKSRQRKCVVYIPESLFLQFHETLRLSMMWVCGMCVWLWRVCCFATLQIHGRARFDGGSVLARNLSLCLLCLVLLWKIPYQLILTLKLVTMTFPSSQRHQKCGIPSVVCVEAPLCGFSFVDWRMHEMNGTNVDFVERIICEC